MATTFKRRIRMEKVALMELNGLSEKEMCIVLRCTKGALQMMKKTPEFNSIRMQYKSGVLAEFGKSVAIDRIYLRERLKEMVPVALQALHEAVIDKKNPKLRYEAAKQILNRDGALAEVSKSSIVIEDTRTNITKADDEAADALVKAFKSSGGSDDSIPPSIIETIQ